MITEILAPKTGLTAETLRIVQWHKKEGQSVQKDELLVTVETEKTTLDIPSPCSGFLNTTCAQAGESVAVSQVIGYIADTPDTPLPGSRNGRPLISPIARKMAAERGVPLSQVQGTGPNGRIQKEDVARYLQQGPPSDQMAPNRGCAEDSSIRPLSNAVRRATARATAHSKATIPHFYLFSSFDVTDLVAQRERRSQRTGLKTSMTTVLLKASGAAIEKQAAMMRKWESDSPTASAEVRVGFVVKTDLGIMIPHVLDPHRMATGALEATVRELVGQAQECRLSEEALRAGTMSISNLGMYPVDCFVPIVYPGEAAMLGIGRIDRKPVWDGKAFVPRDILQVTCSFDHRLIDGAEGAEFVQELKRLLEATEWSGLLQ